MSSVQPAPAESPRRHRRFLERFTSIRAKLGFVIVFAVGMTVLLTYLLVGYALRGSSHDARQLALIDSARHAASDPSYRPPGGVTIVRRSPGGRWDQRPPVALPVRNDRRRGGGGTVLPQEVDRIVSLRLQADADLAQALG